MVSTSFSKITNYPSAWLLIVANLFPILGIIFLNFDILTIFLIYWTESGIVGFYSILKIPFIKHTSLNMMSVVDVPIETQKTMLTMSKIFMIPFFIVHFGVFMLGHLIFILAFFAPAFPFSVLPFNIIGVALSYFKTIWIGVLLLLISHGYSFYVNYLRSGEYHKLNFQSAMIQPYKRITIMHITLIFGGFFFIFSGQLIAILILFIIFKIIVDLGSHLKERETFGNITC